MKSINTDKNAVFSVDDEIREITNKASTERTEPFIRITKRFKATVSQIRPTTWHFLTVWCQVALKYDENILRIGGVERKEIRELLKLTDRTVNTYIKELVLSGFIECVSSRRDCFRLCSNDIMCGTSTGITRKNKNNGILVKKTIIG